MHKSRCIALALFAALIFCRADNLSAQLTANLDFCISVSEALGVIGPTAPVSIVHDGLVNDNVFPSTQWNCIANDPDGSVITFSTLTAMTHQTLPVNKRDVRLDLTVSASDPGSGWSATIASDQTDYAAVVPDEIATVQAESTDAGNATLDLTVTFITGDTATLLPGIYCTTITAK